MASPQTWATVIDSSTDATFRTWGSEFGSFATLCGLVQTADTGQINWTTVVRNTAAAGYEIWRLVDSTLFMKIEYGGAGATTTPMMWATVGTGSNGSGTLTGQTCTRAQIFSGLLPTNTTTAFVSYMSRTADSFSFAFKTGGGSSAAYNVGSFIVGKTVDGTGAATTTGFAVLRQEANTALSFQCVRTVATATTFSDLTSGAVALPGLPTSSLTAAGAFQAYELWMNVPEVQPYIWAAAVLTAEIPRSVSYQAAMAGSTLRTYVSLGSTNGGGNVMGFSQALYSWAMIYE